MTNVHYLPFPKKQENQTEQEYKKHLDDLGLSVRDSLKNMADSLPKIGVLHKAIKSLIVNQNVRESVSLSKWASISYAMTVREVESFTFSMFTDMRERLFPEFGIQKYTEFLTATMTRSGDNSIALKTVFPNHIGEDLAAHYASFPELPSSNLISFNYCFLFQLLEEPGIAYINHGVIDGGFELELKQCIDEVWWSIHYRADFLPILLDNQALLTYQK